MPGLDFATRPLTRFEISQVLHGITDTPATPTSIKSAAFWSTVAGLAGWCDTTDIDATIDQQASAALVS
jgi:hypothetical protein